MRVIQTAHKLAVDQEWTELAGPFPTLFAAEQYVDSPPPDLGDPGTVTIDRKGAEGFWFVWTLEQVKPKQEQVDEQVAA